MFVVVSEDDVLVAVPAPLDTPVLVEDEVVLVSIGSAPESMTVTGLVTSELVLVSVAVSGSGLDEFD